MIYDKDFLVRAFMWRYKSLGDEEFIKLLNMTESFYDEVGKDQFRVSCSLDANALKEFKESDWANA